MFDALGSPPTQNPRPAAFSRLPARFERRPHLLANALSAAKGSSTFFEDLADFVLPRLPRRPLASSSLHTLHAHSEFQLLDDAVSAEAISFNTADWTNAIGVDCDHTDAQDLVDAFMPYLLAEDPQAPRPLIVSDWWTGRAHVTWWLEKPVYTGQQAHPSKSERVLRTLDTVRRGLCTALKGDSNFTNRLSKNPFSTGRCPSQSGKPANFLLWDYYVDTGCPMRFHTLTGDLRGIGLLTVWRALKACREDTGEQIQHARKRTRPNPADGEKGNRLFNASRFVVYDLGTSDLDAIRAIVSEQAALLGSPAGEKQCRSIASSIARFMRTRWTGRKGGGHPSVRRGIMGLGSASLDLSERQALGGKFAAKTRAERNDEKIASALAQMQSRGSKITQAAVAQLAGVSERTVRNRWNLGLKAAPPKPAVRCLSGIAAFVAPRSEGPRHVFLKEEPSTSLASIARYRRDCARVICLLSKLTSGNKRRGYDPTPIPRVPPRLATDPVVRVALKSAQAAFDDSKRRAAARFACDEARARADMFRQWAVQRDGWTLFREHIADLEMAFDLRAQQATGRDAARLPYTREAVLKARWRTWKMARLAVLPPALQPVRDEDIPW